MIGLVLVTHGRLAQELLSALEHVMQRQEAVEAISIAPDDDMDRRRSDIVDAVHRVDGGQGVVIATDMFGGTPCNMAISVMGEANVEVIAGVNLPMLVKLSKARMTMTLAEAVEAATAAGRSYIIVASEMLRAKA